MESMLYVSARLSDKLLTSDSSPQVIISEVDLFDYSRGEPGPQYMTALRALEVGFLS